MGCRINERGAAGLGPGPGQGTPSYPFTCQEPRSLGLPGSGGKVQRARVDEAYVRTHPRPWQTPMSSRANKHVCRTAPAVRQATLGIDSRMITGRQRWPGFSGISTTGLDAVVRACEMGNEAMTLRAMLLHIGSMGVCGYSHIRVVFVTGESLGIEGQGIVGCFEAGTRQPPLMGPTACTEYCMYIKTYM